MDRRAWLLGLGAVLAVGAVPAAARNFSIHGSMGREVDAETPAQRRRRRQRGIGDAERRKAKRSKAAKAAKKVKTAKKAPRRKVYEGREIVSFRSREKPGTIVVKTRERALYYVLGGGMAMRYGVAVGKQGFSWSGVARVGHKKEWPDWTPPPEMIDRSPEYAEWAGGMPGGLPENPLGARAIYLYQGKRDTQFRIHGTNKPASIGTAASSGCIRMLNEEVIELYEKARIGAKVVVL